MINPGLARPDTCVGFSEGWQDCCYGTDPTLCLILGDQLNRKHLLLERVNPAVTYVMMEVRQKTDVLKHHIQKIAGFFAAMSIFAEELSAGGHEVISLSLDDPANRQSFEENIQQLVRYNGFKRFEHQLPDENRLDRQLAELSERLPIHPAPSIPNIF